jgi:hypothetical protein
VDEEFHSPRRAAVPEMMMMMMMFIIIIIINTAGFHLHSRQTFFGMIDVLFSNLAWQFIL